MPSLNVDVVTFNCGRTLINADVFQTILFGKLPHNNASLPDILVLCLEEVAPIAVSFLGGRFLTNYFDAFRHAVQVAATSRDSMSYINIITRNVGLTAIMVFVRQDHEQRIASLETAGVGFGVLGMGNKGAVGVRVGYFVSDERNEIMEATFVAAHFAPHEGKDRLDRRNQDWKSSTTGLVFTSVGSKEEQATPADDENESAPLLYGVAHTEDGNLYGGTRPNGDLSGKVLYGIYKPTSHLFYAGDLNYRTAGGPPRTEDYARYPQPTTDRTDLKHYSQLLAHDELRHEMKVGRVMQSLVEAKIDFPPTYKYNNYDMISPMLGEDVTEWPWKQKRWPSWCDRVLWTEMPRWMKSGAEIKVNAYSALPLLKTSDHRAVALSVTLPLQTIPNPSAAYVNALLQDQEFPMDSRLAPPYSLDPDWKSNRDSARKKEVVAGIVMYLTWTYEGWILLLTIFVGLVVGWQTVEYLRHHGQVSPTV